MSEISDKNTLIKRKKSKSAIEILKNTSNVLNNSREATNIDELMQIIKTRLNSYNNDDKSTRSGLKSGDDTMKYLHSGRLSKSLIKHSVKKENCEKFDGNNKLLRKIGVPKQRRSLLFIKNDNKQENSPLFGNKLINSGFLSPERSLNENIDNIESSKICEKDPLAVTPVKNMNNEYNNFPPEDKLIITPAKARKYSICSDVEYDRVYESIKNSKDHDFSIDGVRFIDNFDVIDEILDDKVMDNLLNQDLPHTQDEKYDNDDVETSSRRSSLRKKRKLKDYIDFDDSELENILEELSEPLPDATIKKLRGIIVNLDHPILPQHEIEQGTIRRAPTTAERQQFEKYAKIKDGHFSPAENQILENNWKHFCNIHGLEIPQIQFFKTKYHNKFYIESPEERRKFIQFLAHDLPWRTLRAVYLRFKSLYGYKKEVKKKRYTLEEDEKIIKYMETNLPIKKSEILPQLLGRSYNSIFQHYLQLKKRREESHDGKNVVWNLSLMEKFLKHLMDITISEDVSELKDAIIPKIIWIKLGEVMGIDYNVLKEFWAIQFHAQLFFPRVIYFNEIKIMIIEYLYGKGITHVDEINWSKMSQYFDGLTTSFLVRMCPRLHAKGDCKTFGDLIEKLYEEKIPILKIQLYDYYLPRVSYVKGKLRIIDHFF